MAPKPSVNPKLIRVVDSAGGLVVNNGQVCLAWQPRRKNWAIPKGTIEAGETPVQAAIREVREETGIIAEPVKELGMIEREGLKGEDSKGRDLAVWKTIHMFLFRTDEEELKPTDTKTKHMAKWYTLDEAVNINSYPEEKEFLLKHKKEILKR